MCFLLFKVRVSTAASVSSKLKGSKKINHIFSFTGRFNLIGVAAYFLKINGLNQKSVSDLGYPARGAMCPSQQFSEGHNLLPV